MKKVKDSCYKVFKKTNGSEQMEQVKDWNYKVVEKIGQGVFGEVYKCLNLKTGKKVAIKMITIQNGPEGVPSYLISRVSLLKELEHDNIVRLLNVLTSGRYVYLVFEYLDLDLGSFIRKHTITSIRPLIKTILSQILVGLAYCHSHNILHGDLQPSNVLIDLNSKKVKLADFGLALSFGVPHTEYILLKVVLENEFLSQHYRMRASAGVKSYKAPETRICSSVYSTPHDVWAVGCIFAEMVAGKPRFPCRKRDHLSLIVSLFSKPTKETWPGVNYISELHSHPQCEPADLAQQLLGLGLEPPGVELLCQMLCLDPDLRVTANDALLHRYLRHAEDLRNAETVSFKLPSSNSCPLVKKFLKGDSKVPSCHPAAVRKVQKQDFKVESQYIKKRSSPSAGQGVFSCQMHDKYEYKRVIAKTRGAVVHKCRHYETDRIVAIKNINFKAPSEGVPSSVIREVALLKKLEHEYIVRLLDVQSDVKSVNLVFECVDVTLHNIIQLYHPIESRWIKKFLYCILGGISYLHAHKFLHRDLTPMNLLVDIKNKIVKIADFGMAEEVDAPFDTHTTEEVTLNYRAPELLLGRTNYSAAIDMWAVGCIFAEMVKGKCLFSGIVKYDVLHGIFSYFGMPDADTLLEVTLLSDHSLLKPIDKLNLAEELTRLEPDGLDLLFRLLSLNPTTRITAESALNHPYFKGGTCGSPL